MANKELIESIIKIRDVWLSSPPISSEDLSILAENTSWHPKHILEAIRRAFLPFTDTAILRVAGYPSKGYKEVLVILAGKIPATTVRCCFLGILANSKVVLKPSSQYNVFAHLFVRSIKQYCPDISKYVELLDVPSDSEILKEKIENSDLVVAYGSDKTIENIIAKRGSHPTVLGRHMESFSIIFKDGLEDWRSVAHAMAEDIAIYDQSGCLSPQAIFVENHGTVSVERFAHLLFEELMDIERDIPKGVINQYLGVHVRLYAQQLKFLAKTANGLVLHDKNSIVPMVVLLPPSIPYISGPGSRIIQVFHFSDLPPLMPTLKGMALRVQGLSFSGDYVRLQNILKIYPDLQPHYICAVGQLQRPPLDFRENGNFLLGMFSDITHQ